MVTVGLAFSETTTLLLVEYKDKVHLNNYSTNEKYITYKARRNDEKKEWLSKLTSEELAATRIAARSDDIQDQKDSAASALISIFAWMITGLLFFIIHWNMYKKAWINRS